MRAMAPAGAGSGAPETDSSHTTTPEKSMCLRTAASFESRSSTRPDIDPAARFVAMARLSSNTNGQPLDDSRGSEVLWSRDSDGAGLDICLKKVREREIIMWIDECTRAQISCAHLRSFKAR